MTDTPRHSVSVAGIVVNNADQVLVVQRRDNGRWEPPGGILELDEQFEDGVRREILEETGVNVEVERLTGVYKNLNVGVVALVFRCAPLGDPQSGSAEASAVRWAELGEIPNLMTPAYAVRVTDAFENATAIRAHDGIQLVTSWQSGAARIAPGDGTPHGCSGRAMSYRPGVGPTSSGTDRGATREDRYDKPGEEHG